MKSISLWTPDGKTQLRLEVDEWREKVTVDILDEEFIKRMQFSLKRSQLEGLLER